MHVLSQVPEQVPEHIVLQFREQEVPHPPQLPDAVDWQLVAQLVPHPFEHAIDITSSHYVVIAPVVHPEPQVCVQPEKQPLEHPPQDVEHPSEHPLAHVVAHPLLHPEQP